MHLDCEAKTSFRHRDWVCYVFTLWAMACEFVCHTSVLDSNLGSMCSATLQERRWFFIRNGKPEDYHGPAVHWRHLSRWERHVCKTHLQYDPVEDLRQRRESNSYNRMSVTNPLQDVKGKVASNGNADGYNNAPNPPVNAED